MISKSNIQYFWYLLLCFYIFYTPEFFLAINIPIRSQLVILVINFYIFIKILIRKTFDKKIYINWNRSLTLLYVGVLLSSIYFFIIAILSGKDTRFIQNIYILFQLFPLIFFISKLDLLGKTRIQKIIFLYNMTIIHGISVLLMFIFPNLKNIALSLYYLGREENIFISTMRIYGISGEYTFFTPIFHGIALGLAIYFIFFENQKIFFIYIPFLFLSIISNGRTGLLVAFILIIIQIVFLIFLQSKNILKIFFFISMMFMFVMVMMWILKEVSEPTYLWINQSFEDIKVFFSDGDKQGTIDALSNMILWPSGINILFGMGFRLYGNKMGYIHSDIGFVNDMFMGGIIYCSLLYGTLMLYLFDYRNFSISISRKVLLDLLFMASLIIGNYKGEALRGGPIIIGVIIFKYLIIQRRKPND